MAAAFTPGPTYADAPGANGMASAAAFLKGDRDGMAIGARARAMKFFGAPGQDGQGSKNFGLRTQKIQLHVTYVDTSASNLAAAWQTDTDNLKGPCSLAMDGVTFGRCFLEPQATHQGQIKSTGLGTFYMDAVIVVTDMPST